jgi:uncharacterized membrane protein
MMHFLSDANETFGDLLPDKAYPFAFMLACAGYVLTMLAECAISFVVARGRTKPAATVAGKQVTCLDLLCISILDGRPAAVPAGGVKVAAQHGVGLNADFLVLQICLFPILGFAQLAVCFIITQLAVVAVLCFCLHRREQNQGPRVEQIMVSPLE